MHVVILKAVPAPCPVALAEPFYFMFIFVFVFWLISSPNGHGPSFSSLLLVCCWPPAEALTMDGLLAQKWIPTAEPRPRYS